MRRRSVLRWCGAAALSVALAVLAHSLRAQFEGPAPSAAKPQAVRSPEAGPRAGAPGHGAPQDPFLPAGETRLLEQIESARVGLQAAQASIPANPPRTQEGRLFLATGLLALGAGLMGGAAGALAVRARSRRRAPKATVKGPTLEIAASGFAGEMDVSIQDGHPAPGGAEGAILDPVEERVHSIESSLLQVLTVLEELTAKETPPPAAGDSRPAPAQGAVPSLLPWELEGATRGAPENGPVPAPSLDQRPDRIPVGRGEAGDIGPQSGPGLDRDLTLVHPNTADGRNLGRIRAAVLRLGQEGWTRDRIARQLRLGEADVGLILRSAESTRPRVRDEEMARTGR